MILAPRRARRRIRVDGTGLDNLTEDGCFTREFARSPDGTRIAFDTVRNLLSDNHREIYAIRTDGCDEIRPTTTAGIDMEPADSPDGSRIVFIAYRDGAATNGEIHTMRADGTDPQRITNTTFRETKPTFSPPAHRSCSWPTTTALSSPMR